MTACSMEEERSRVSENILHLTLEIICLLTGERCAVVKMAAIEGLLQGLYPPLSGEQNPITVPPPTSPTCERNIEQKILEVINQVTELLTGERGSPSDGNIVIKQEVWEEGDVLEDSQHSEEHKELYGEAIMEDQPMDGFWKRNLPERSPHLLYSQDSTPEEYETPNYNQGEVMIDIKIKEEEETPVSDDQPTEEVGMTWPFEEDVSTVTDPEQRLLNVISEETLSLSLDCKSEDGDVTDHSSVKDTTTPSMPPGPPSTDRSAAPTNPEGPSLDRPTCVTIERGHGARECSICGKCFMSRVAYNNHQRVHSEHRPYSCSECGKCFKQKVHLAAHQESHARRQSLSCPECGKLFESKTMFALHQRYHAGEKIYTCAECGKEFPSQSKLNQHQKHHTAEKPLACTECDYRSWFPSNLVLHYRKHTGERPFACPGCGRCFRGRFWLHRHRQSKKH